MADSSIFRKAALDRLASPERLDERLALPRYPRLLIVSTSLLLAGTVAFAVWLLSGA
jgi:hypothetical protein